MNKFVGGNYNKVNFERFHGGIQQQQYWENNLLHIHWIHYVNNDKYDIVSWIE